ncbi:MAG: PAS domain-containing protein [Jannaschia sp.]
MSIAAFVTSIAFGGGVTALLALVLVLWLAPKPRPQMRQTPSEVLSEPRHFQFRNGYLVEHSENAGFLLPSPLDHLKAWDDLIDVLGDMADGVAPAFAALRDSGRAFRLDGQFGGDRIIVMGVRIGDDLRISVASTEAEQSAIRMDLASLKVLEGDVDLLTQVSETNPTLSWVVDPGGRVIWSNGAYLRLAEQCAGPDALRGWPLAALFPDEGGAPVGTSRRQIVDRTGTTRWFEITTTAPDAHGMRHMHALSLDPVIAAEDSLRAFIQTLTKTFAYLPTGLAIFDRERTLAMFNPALMDMTGLDGAWLSRRPKLEDFFDALRDHRKLPEPRDYKAWRDGLSDLSRVDAAGAYSETWTLPSGQTYCVTGRPQADGAVALMLEDISADISASRAHQTEREALIGALDALDDAVLAFGPDGVRLAANDAAIRLPVQIGAAALPATLDGCIALWRERFLPSPAWSDLRGVARGDDPEAGMTEWTEMLRAGDGGEVAMRVVPGRAGRLTVCFSVARPSLALDAHPSEEARRTVPAA